MKIKRTHLLNCLESLRPGLAPRENVEQSTCFAFLNGRIWTYNLEIAASVQSPLKIEGAVPADEVLALLQKLKEDEIEVTVEGQELHIKGKGRRSKLPFDLDVQLPINSLEAPTTWVVLPEEFIPALDTVRHSISQDQSQFVVTCVHITPSGVEGASNFQLTRYPLETGLQECLVRGDSVKHIIGLDVTEASEGEHWLHFRNSTGLVLSCRRYVEKFPNISPLFEVDGAPMVLPDGMAEAIDRAEIFSSKNVEANQIIVSVKRGKMLIEGRGVRGGYEELNDVKYDGESFKFAASPGLLREITKRVKNCVISKERLKAETDDFTYVSCLGAVE